jgi:uncharacterized protein (DUF433 family)
LEAVVSALIPRSANELAFIADITERDIYRIVEERLLPRELILEERERRFDPLACVLANFYFHTDVLSKPARLQAIETLVERFKEPKVRRRLFSLRDHDWHVAFGTVTINLAKTAAEIERRMGEVERADALVSTDEIFEGEPVFKGTRVPVRTIAAFLGSAESKERIRESFPTVTEEMIDVASLWAKTHPAKGRPRKFSEINPAWKLKTSKTVKLT